MMQAMKRGPLVLGRSVLVNPGDDPPDEWLNVHRVIASDISNAITLNSVDANDTRSFLRQCWINRKPLVIEISDMEALSGKCNDHVSDWKDKFDKKNLLFYITENAINALDSQDYRWWAMGRGIDLGGLQNGLNQTGDLTKSDGSIIWLDGGPFNLKSLKSESGIPVVPRVNLRQGKLTPLEESQEIDTRLDSEQFRAVTAEGGPTRIIAPAGSGKTRVLTERIRFLVNSGIDPECITAIAYNVRARDEMKSRLSQISGLIIKTFHAFAFGIILDYRNNGTKPKVLGEIEVREILERIVPKSPRRANVDSLEPWVDAINYCRQTLIEASTIPEIFPELAGKNFKDVLSEYREILKEKDAVDYTEMATLACELLIDDEEFCERMRKKVGLLLIDEFQDLTPLFARLTKLIANPSDDVFCVGDDDQTIYSFTGASPTYLVEFDELFPNAHFISLETNYRCPPSVVNAATNLLSHNSYRVVKTVKSPVNKSNESNEIERSELLSISSRIQNQIDDGVSLSDICVLSRTNAALIVPYFLLNQTGIHARKPSSLNMGILERTGIASVLAWLDIANNQINSKTLDLAIKRPRRNISPNLHKVIIKKQSLDEIENFMANNTNPKMVESMSDFVADGRKLRQLAENGGLTESIMKVIIEEIGVGSLLYRLDDSQRTSRKNSHRDELEAFQFLSKLKPDPKEFVPFIKKILSEEQSPSEEHITFSTIHTAKGLEWPHVHIFNVSDSLFPHILAEEVEEERRLFHVGMTRCIETLTLYYENLSRSQFLDELEIQNEQERSRDIHPPVSKVQPIKSEMQYNETLFDELKSWRSEKASFEKVPAYVVAKDLTLKEIAEKQPIDLPTLKKIGGIGPKRLEKYGLEIIKIVKNSNLGMVESEPLEEKQPESESISTSQHPLQSQNVFKYPDLKRHSEEGFKKLQDVYPDLMYRYPRTYVPWTTEEEYILKNLHDAGFSTEEISKKIERNSGAVRSRLRRLDSGETNF